MRIKIVDSADLNKPGLGLSPRRHWGPMPWRWRFTRPPTSL